MDLRPQTSEQSSATSTATDRRVAPRFPSSRKIVCYPVNSGLRERRNGRIRDLSRAGIGISLDRSFPPGTVLMVELPLTEGTKVVRARVVHSTLGMGSTYLVGCSLEAMLSDVEVQALTQ